jgi:hypothetical protein
MIFAAAAQESEVTPIFLALFTSRFDPLFTYGAISAQAALLGACSQVMVFCN